MNAEQQVRTAMQAHIDARIRGDVDTVFDSYSEDWTDSKGFSKDQLREGHLAFTVGATDAKIEIHLDNAEIVVTDDVATCQPVAIYTEKGSIICGYTLRKEADHVWRLIYTQTIDWENSPLDAAGRARKQEIDATAEAVRAHREAMLGDRLRPGYHFVMPEGMASPFDPNGAIFWKGRYHLFYIYQDKTRGRKSDHWGHISSTDLFHWRHHPTGLFEGMYSGNCFLNEDGIPTLCYHQVDQGNALAVALDDELNEWQKLPSNPITPVTHEGDEHHDKYRSWDPFGWYDGEHYYAIFGGEHPAIAKSPRMQGDWHYVGDLFAHSLDDVSLDEDVSCAELFRLGNKDVLLCISHRLGCRYYIGEWRDEQFYPESHAQMSWVDNMFFAPESLEDDQGSRIMWAWIRDDKDFTLRLAAGWSGTLSLPRVLSLGDDGEMHIDVPKEIEALRYQPLQMKDLKVTPGTDHTIERISSNSFELALEVSATGSDEYGVKVCVSPDGEEKTVITYSRSSGTIGIDTRWSGPEGASQGVESAPLVLGNEETLHLRVFVDKSVVEVFANGRQAVMRRIYPSRQDSLGVRLFAEGAAMNVSALYFWEISPSNPY